MQPIVAATTPESAVIHPLAGSTPKRCLVLELWWIGDVTMMTSILQGLLADGWEITVLAKKQSRLLLESSYPTVRWIEFNAPWTAFQGKYRLWRWNWGEIFSVLGKLRREHFAVALSARPDPRDQFFLWLANVRRQVGFRTFLSNRFLSEPIDMQASTRHRVEHWWDEQRLLSSTAKAFFPPRLVADAELAQAFRARFFSEQRPVVALHCGARNAVRRWPEQYFREVIRDLRQSFDFQLVLFPDTDGYGSTLADLAEHTATHLSLPELTAALSCATVLLANDSGPGHLADALGVPAITVFGPGDPNKMRPFGPNNLVVIRDICPYHPCSDYCRFPEPYCLTQLTPAMAIREIRAYLLSSSLLPLRSGLSPAPADKPSALA